MAFKKYFESYSKAFKLPGIKVVDTSFMYCFISRDFLTHVSPDEQKEILDLEMLFLNNLPEMIDDSVSFPKEMLKEYRADVGGKRRLMKRSIRNINQGNRLTGNKFIGVQKERDVKSANAALKRYVNRKKRLINKVLRKLPSEDQIIGDGEAYLENIKEAVERVRSSPEVIINYYGENEGDRGYNDASIFSKGVAISYNSPVWILTKDSDFIRMGNKFERNKLYFGAKFGFPIPAYSVNVLFVNDGEFSVHDTRTGERRSLLGVEKLVEF